MAALMRLKLGLGLQASFHFLKMYNNPQFILKRNICTTSTFLSQYSPKFIEPIVSPEEQAMLDETVLKEMAYSPVKAAKSDFTCSIFHDELYRLLIIHVMMCGRKDLARELVDRTLQLVKRTQMEKYREATTDDERAEIECNPRKILLKAVNNGSPVAILSSVKRGGITYRVPQPVRDFKGRSIAMKWLIAAARERQDRKVLFPAALAKELVDAANSVGSVVKKKRDLHVQCDANKAYVHFRSI